MRDLGLADLAVLGFLIATVAALSVAVVRLTRRRAAPRAAGADNPSETATAAPPVAAQPAAADSAAVAAAATAAAELRARAERDAAELRRQAETALARSAEECTAAQLAAERNKAELGDVRADLERRERRLAEREERLHGELRRLEDVGVSQAARAAELDRRSAAVDAAEAERRQLLERTAGLSAAEAKAELVATVAQQAKREAAVLVRDLERQARATAEAQAREIVAGAIQRLATEQTTESVVSVLHLPGDEMKGRIIGREGRNIRAFEQVTGVNLIIDDTPEAVLLSCFDPVRREVARLTLEALVLDGRIHPHRIEEQYARSRTEVERLCVRAGEDAVIEFGITDMHPELVALLGRLRYRTSYGQNVLKHLVESAHLAGLMAAELGLEVALLQRCALLHDIGKALTHEVDGSHAVVGADVARRFGEHEDVVHAIEAHHDEVEPRTVEAVLTQAADAISGGRPGARRESLESYVARLQRLEEIAIAHEGVDKVFAMQAGREVRVMVAPDVVDDIQAQVLARDIAKQVEEELTYPGQIRVTVIRESRATEVAR